MWFSKGNKFSKLIVDGTNVLTSKLLRELAKLNRLCTSRYHNFNQSLRENILFGSDRNILNDKNLKSLIKRVDLEKFLKKQKMVYLKF